MRAARAWASSSRAGTSPPTSLPGSYPLRRQCPRERIAEELPELERVRRRDVLARAFPLEDHVTLGRYLAGFLLRLLRLALLLDVVLGGLLGGLVATFVLGCHGPSPFLTADAAAILPCPALSRWTRAPAVAAAAGRAAESVPGRSRSRPRGSRGS